MYGYHTIPFTLEQEEVSISVAREGGTLRYLRSCGDEKVERILLAEEARLLLCPVEPLNKPQALSSHLLVKFDSTLMAPPKASHTVFLSFPVEIAVHVEGNGGMELLDVFTRALQKLTLYGDPRSGMLCRYWKSPVFTGRPVLPADREGVLELRITNPTASWIQVGRAVFNAYGMKLYYHQELVSMKAGMRLRSAEAAETEFEDAPLEEGMQKSPEVFLPRKLTVTSARCLMECGL